MNTHVPGFQSGFLHHLALAKLAISSIMIIISKYHTLVGDYIYRYSRLPPVHRNQEKVSELTKIPDIYNTI